MGHQATLPFTILRSRDVIAKKEITSTRETVHGLLRLDGERVLIQWRTSRAIDRVGSEIRSDSEVDAVRELSLPLSALAGAEFRSSWLPWSRLQVILTGADMRAFESLAGSDGLQLTHPAQFAIRVARDARAAAIEFVSELELALADRALRDDADVPGQLEGKARPVLGPPKDSA